MKTTALLDMDGVLADFMSGYHEVMISEFGVAQDHPSPTQYDLDKHYAMPTGTLHNIIAAQGFFQNLAPTPWAHWLVQECLDRFDTVAVLTAYHPNISEKRRWLQKYFPQLADNLVMTSAKHLLARPGAILFDDLQKNCEAFCAERDKQGGYNLCGSVLIQAPYNTANRGVYTLFDEDCYLDLHFPNLNK